MYVSFSFFYSGPPEYPYSSVLVAYRFNRRETEFQTLRDYNNYLEEVETLTFNLLYNVDVAITEEKLASYSRQNAADIANNKVLSAQESASTEAQLAAQKEQARLRREAARNEEDEERREKEEGRREIINQITNSNEDPDKIAKVVLKKSTARRTAADKLRQQEAAKVDNASAPLFQIQGLKPVMRPEAAKAYDPFGDYAIKTEYYTLQPQYEHAWLEKARTDAHITAGGFDVGEYCARAMMEASSGLGVFVEDEVAGREGGTAAEIGTTAAAMAAGDREGNGDDVF